MLEKDLPIITTTYNQLNSYVYKRDGQHFKPFGQDGMTFLDFLDIINPLQHIPLVSTIYRKITGDVIDPASKIAGSALYSGPIGAVTSFFDVLIEHKTGKDFVEHALNMTSQDDTTPKKVADINQTNANIAGNYWRELSPKKTEYKRKNPKTRSTDLNNVFIFNSSNNALKTQSMLLKNIHSEINIEDKMISNEKRGHNRATGAYNNTFKLTT